MKTPDPRPARHRPDGRPVRRAAFVSLPIHDGTPYLSAFERLQVRPSIGLRYLASVLEARGIAVDVLDLMHDPAAAGRIPERLNARRYDLVGFYMSSASRKVVLDAASRLDPDWYGGRVLAGGPGAMLHAAEVAGAGIDIVALGEAEDTIGLVVDAIAGRRPFADIPGIAYRTADGALRDQGKAPPVDVARLPFPSWKDHSPAFGDMANVTMKRPFFVMLASRGCPFRCAFCAVPALWECRYRARPVDSVLDEMQWLVRERGARYIHFIDDVFALAPGWLDAFCDGVRDRGIRVEFSVILHPSSFRDDRARSLRRLREAGCRLVSYGAQSAVPEVLRNVHRAPSETDELRRALPLLHELDVASVLTYIVGLPGDTLATVRRNLDFACEVKPTLLTFIPILDLAGSEMVEAMPAAARTRMSPAEIQRFSARGIAHYYFRAGGAARLAAFILRNNPSWLLNALPVARFAAAYLPMLGGRGGDWGRQSW
ncbi:MAG TPA: radical SAM protein [Myxococcota bacterium]|jgi:radical SAM superfamily enzyme YgiQ (UPF0313 family)|nr:radical SAM protein [Myxococcota bacterium]